MIATAVKKKPEPKVDFIRLEPIIEIVRAAVWTGRLADEKPVSIILIAEQESAKTEALKFFRGTDTLQFQSDLTTQGLAQYQREIEQAKIRHFVILDLVRIVNHNQTVSRRTISTLASLMEEGESETADGGGKNRFEGWPRIGCLSSITPAYYRAKAGDWRRTGFLSRFLPVRFKYKPETVLEIHRAIACGHQIPQPRPEKVPPANVLIRVLPKDAATIGRTAESLGLANGVYGFRYHRSLRALAKACALMRNCGEVEPQDMSKVLEWSQFFTEKEIEL